MAVDPAPWSRQRHRLVCPTTMRSLATSTAARAKASFSACWRAPNSTIPGVTTTSDRRLPETGKCLEGGDGTGRVGVVGVVNYRDTSGRGHHGTTMIGTGQPAAAAPISSGDIPTASAGTDRTSQVPREERRSRRWQLGCGRCRRRRLFAPSHRRRCREEEQRTPGHRMLCQLGETGVVDVEDGHIGGGEDLLLRPGGGVERAEPLEMDGPDGGDHRNSGRTQLTKSVISPGPYVPIRPRRPRRPAKVAR